MRGEGKAQILTAVLDYSKRLLINSDTAWPAQLAEQNTNIHHTGVLKESGLYYTDCRGYNSVITALINLIVRLNHSVNRLDSSTCIAVIMVCVKLNSKSAPVFI